MNVEDLLDQIDELIDDAPALPLSGGKHAIKVEKLRAILEDVRMNLPEEVRQAKAIAADRLKIIEDAKKEAAEIRLKAEEHARQVTARDEIVRNAQSIANDILSQAQAKSQEVRKAATDFVDDLVGRCEETLTANLNDLKKARVALKAQKQHSASKAAN